MEVKIDTKEKLHVLTPNAPVLTANLASELAVEVTKLQAGEIKNVVLNLSNTDTIENDTAAGKIAQLQQQSLEKNVSFVICHLNAAIQKKLDDLDLLDSLNIAPTESEAMDIVQMEEIERELLDEME